LATGTDQRKAVVLLSGGMDSCVSTAIARERHGRRALLCCTPATASLRESANGARSMRLQISTLLANG